MKQLSKTVKKMKITEECGKQGVPSFACVLEALTEVIVSL
jgi:hypothetical protein